MQHNKNVSQKLMNLPIVCHCHAVTRKMKLLYTSACMNSQTQACGYYIYGNWYLFQFSLFLSLSGATGKVNKQGGGLSLGGGRMWNLLQHIIGSIVVVLIRMVMVSKLCFSSHQMRQLFVILICVLYTSGYCSGCSHLFGRWG